MAPTTATVLTLPGTVLECTWIGTGHYYWFTRVQHRGVDLLPASMRLTREAEPLSGEAGLLDRQNRLT